VCVCVMWTVVRFWRGRTSTNNSFIFGAGRFGYA
jgi:hypothetical protein